MNRSRTREACFKAYLRCLHTIRKCVTIWQGDYLETILSQLSTNEIVEWVIKDKKLYSNLSSPFYSSDATIAYHGSYQPNPRLYNGVIRNYILEVFNETKWVMVGEKRYSPREILQNYNARNNNKFADVVPVIGEEYLKDIAVKINESYELVYDVFMKFNFCSRVTDLCSEDFYGLMLKLPSMDFQTSSDLSKTIYRIIEQPSFNKTYGDSENKERFSSDGQVLVKYHGKLQFYPAKKAYLPSSKMILRKSFYVVDKGQRTNNENFVRLFGCQEYNREYKINKNSISVSAANNRFQEYFHEFKRFAAAYGERNENIQRNAGNLRITLVSSISVTENDVLAEVEEEYHPPRNENTGKPKTGSSGVFTRTAAEKRQRNQKILGNKGELLIYNHLCQQVGKDKVIPRSEAYVELGIIKPGQAISGEYDISYIDNDGTEYFVEVKTGDGKSFIISPAELEFAKENADRYKLFLVFNIDDEEPAYIELPARFWDNPQYRRKEIIERIEFEF